MAGFEPVDPKMRFPALERRVLEFWTDADIFRQSLDLRDGAPEWVFYEGPPTANGKPGIHHVEPRTFKDVYPRFKTMTGHLVRRKGGWDCHGLPVELEVEKEIGTTGKRDIEAFGIAEFNRLCRESVQRYVGEFEQLTERIGFWIDMSDAYWTMSPEYIESVWWSLKQLHELGLLVEADKVTAYCPRCGTALSDAEVAQGYRQTKDPSIVVRLPIAGASDPALVGASLLVWTTTPWTLPSNTGAAVAPDEPYVRVHRDGEDDLILAEAAVERTLGPGWQIVQRFAGRQLTEGPGARYEPPYANVEGAHRVVPADFVSMNDGTGIVHLAPAFGPDDLAVGMHHGWPVFKPVADDGTFTDEAPSFIRGLFIKDADPKIVGDLEERGLLFASSTVEHSYPFCWRCATPLLYYARTSWYVRTTAVKDRLLAANETVHWFPEHIKHGRFGNWLENNIDWALSRERYWGTPLPIWRCGRGHQTAVGSLAELGNLTGRNLAELDPHRPAIDSVTIACGECGEPAARVPEVIDTWYDSGAMPFAQWGYHPDLGRGLDEFARSFPADFISEAIDQTRGWFYTLLAEGVLLFDRAPYRNVVCLGHLVDRDGRKMSKSLGNIIDPFDVLDRHGADALRWFLITSGSPWASRRVSMEAFDDIVRQFLLPLWNVYAFFVTYANAEGFDPAASEPAPPPHRPAIDRWILSRLHHTIQAARSGLETYDATGGGRAIQSFVGDLSNWYVRRSRRRFWNPGGGRDSEPERQAENHAERQAESESAREGGGDVAAAFRTLHECLTTVATLLAPFTPFVAEELWRNLTRGTGAPESVHLADYPTPEERLVDERLEEAMAAARHIVELGRRIRVETKTKIRQPLAEAVVHLPGDHAELQALLPVIEDELNVKTVTFAETAARFGRWRAKPNYKSLGPRLGSGVKDIATILGRDDGSMAGRVAAGDTIELELDGGSVTLGPGDVDLVQEIAEGWGVASERGVTVALDLDVTEDLRLEGVARELVRAVQDARKSAGLDVSDRIVLGIDAGGRAAEAATIFERYIAGETLATSLGRSIAADPILRQETDVDGDTVRIMIARA